MTKADLDTTLALNPEGFMLLILDGGTQITGRVAALDDRVVTVDTEIENRKLRSIVEIAQVRAVSIELPRAYAPSLIVPR